LATAAGLAALDVYRDEGLFERAKTMAPVFEEALHSLKGARHVIDIRNAGLMGAVELAPREGQPTQRAMDVFRRCYDAGVLVRATGDIIALTPPLIVTGQEIAQIVDTLRAAIMAVD
jgi:beta-alanine--pyruvate transaminase